MTENEKRIREKICEIGKIVYQKNMVAANDGNISAKLDEDIFICTPTGVSKGFLTPEMLCKINGKCEILEENASGYRPSSEMKMHLVVYRERADVKAVVHAHPQHATAYAICHRALDRQIMPEATVGLGIVPLAPYAPPSTAELSESIVPYLQDHDAVLMANHGAVSYGQDVTAAYYKMEALEFYATLIYMSEGIGKPKEFSNKEVEKLLDLRENVYKVPGRHPGRKCLE